MKCKKCGAEFYDSGELCGKCKAQEISNIPTGVFLNQIDRPYGQPDNLPLQTLGGKELKGAKFKDVLIGLGIILMLVLVFVGLVIFLCSR